jgi:hypothetical protein
MLLIISDLLLINLMYRIKRRLLQQIKIPIKLHIKLVQLPHLVRNFPKHEILLGHALGPLLGYQFFHNIMHLQCRLIVFSDNILGYLDQVIMTFLDQVLQRRDESQVVTV